MRLEVNDFDNYKPPGRLPWLPIALLVIGGILFLTRRDSGEPRPARMPADVPVALEEERDSASADEAPRTRVPGMRTADTAQGRPQGTVNVADLLKKADALAAEDPPAPEPLNEARRIYEEVLEQPIRSSVRTRVERSLGELNMRLTLTPMPMAEKVKYVVKSGDSLDRIAKKFGTTVQLLQRSNMVMNPNLIRKGDSFLVFNGRFRIDVSKSRRDLVVYLNDKFFKRYLVGTGKFGRTPVGTFEIVERIKEPTWWRPDGKEIPFGHEENILGTHWMEIRATGDTPDVKGYGIHGTWRPDSIGKEESAGCVRMINDEVGELFDLLPLRTPIHIFE